MLKYGLHALQKDSRTVKVFSYVTTGQWKLELAVESEHFLMWLFSFVWLFM